MKMIRHDPYCKAFYPALLPVENCNWCYVIAQVREDERQKFLENGYEYLKEYMPKYEDIDKEVRAQRIQRGIDKWKADIDIAYWQGYNSATINKDKDC